MRGFPAIKQEKSKVSARLWQGSPLIMGTMKGGNRMTIITTEIQKWKRNKIVWCILALTLLLGAFAIERACSISRSSPFMDSFGDLLHTGL